MPTRRLLKICVVLMALTPFLSSCACFSNAGKIVAGTSTRALEQSPAEFRLKKTFRAEFPAVYQKTLSVLKERNALAFLHSQKKQRIVAMNLLQETDTTEIGIFFTPINQEETEVEIVSLSPGHLKLAAQLIFSELDKSFK